MATSTGSDSNNKKPNDVSELSNSEYARVGISMWLNNKPLEAEDHFKKRKSSLQVEAGYTFVSFMVCNSLCYIYYVLVFFFFWK